MGSHKVLKTSSEVDDAINHIRSLDLFAHHDRVKSWDIHKMIDIITGAD
jgi:hypothetical protein